MSRLALILSSGLGVGYIPWAPGTFGSLWGLLLFFLLKDLSPWTFGWIVLGIFVLSVGSAHLAEKRLGVKDSSVIVIDEVVGYLVTVLGLSFSFRVAALAFILFRLFDIFKPFPIRQLERRLSGGLGVVLDDVLAGIFANISLRVILWLWPLN